MAWRVKAATCHIGANSLPGCFTSTQLPTRSLGKAVEDGLGVWTPVTLVGDPDEALDPGFDLSQP